jgi:hypothetical protein
MKRGSTPPLAECPLLPLGSSSSYSKCHAGCVSVLFFQGPIPFLVTGAFRGFSYRGSRDGPTTSRRGSRRS